MTTPPPSARRLPLPLPPSQAPSAWPVVSLIVSMVLAVVAVAAVSFWEEVREGRAALDDFAREQTMLAAAMAGEIGARAAAVAQGGKAPGPEVLLQGVAQVERAGGVRVLLLSPGERVLRGTDGAPVESVPIVRALGDGQSSVWILRPDALALGMPPRRAAVGLAVADAGPLGRFGVAVVSSATRMREREDRARVRVGIGVLLTAGLVAAFGSLALRRQRRGLLLERELALAAVARARDAELATAGRAAMMGTLAMGIAHEVSTPLGVITGRAEQLVPRVAADPRAARSVEAILEQGDRIRRVIQGFLGLARSGAPALADAPPPTVVEGAVALVAHRFDAAGVTLASDVPADLPALHGDVAMLQQALVNLLLNACDACARGGRVEIRVRSDGDKLAFSVIDDGRGIGAEEAARALEPFFTTKSAGQGTGLGLAIANEIVKLHRGTLSLRAASPRGTTASVILPLPKVKPDAA